MTSLITSDNCYLTLEEAETYFSTRLNAEKWDAETDTNKEKALIMATKRIDSLRFQGFLCDNTQKLQFPRYIFANYLSKRTYTDKINEVLVNGRWMIYIEVSDQLKEAVCEEALTLFEQNNSVHLKNQQLGIKSISLGAGSVSYETNNNQISLRALQLIDKYLQKVGKVV